MNITKTDVEDYVATLDPQVKQLYYDADNIRLGYRDTLDDEFQIVSDIINIFWQYANKYNNEEE